MFDRTLEILHKMASDKNKSKREYFLMSSLLTGRAEVVSQVKSYGERFKVGFRPPIHGKITTLPMK
jgi:hypothetical protein